MHRRNPRWVGSKGFAVLLHDDVDLVSVNTKFGEASELTFVVVAVLKDILQRPRV